MTTQNENYFWAVHSGLPREGPGNNESTRRAFSAIPDLPNEPFILDVACGPGMQTLELAKLSNGNIFAVDLHQDFLDELDRRAEEARLSEQITTINASMTDLPFDEDSFDLIWCEGAIYIMGFANGLRQWKPLLNKGGCIAVSNVTYLRSDVPDPVREFWEADYPEIATVDTFLKRIDDSGYSLLDHFTLPPAAWMDEYYLPMEQRLTSLRATYDGNSDALRTIEECQREIEMYRKFSDYYGYVFYIMQSI